MSPNSASSFNEIYNAFYRKSYLFVKSYVHDDLAAEDIVSEALIKLWERIKREPVDPINHFLFAILKNQSLDYLKHQTIKRSAHDAMAKALNRELEIRTNLLEANDPNEIFSTEVQQIIESTLSSLPEKTKEIFILSHFGNKPYKDIADLYQITVKGVDYHMMQSIKALKYALKDYVPFVGALSFLQ